jgi:nucleotide-binding universal stress UspA family protein
MAMRFDGPVLIGLEPSDAGLSALDLAAEIAIGRGTGLTVLYATGDARRGGQVLAAAADRVRKRHRSLPVATELTGGDLASELMSRSPRCGLIMVGHYGRRGARSCRAAAGSVALRVAAGAPVPVVVHRPVGCGHDERPVIVGVGAVSEDEPLAFAFTEADRRGVPLVVEHVWSCAADSAPASAGVDRCVETAALAEAARMLDDTVATWSDKFPDVEVRRALRHGLDPVFALTAASRSACLLVVGSTELSAPLVRALVHRAGCPVALVPYG